MNVKAFSHDVKRQIIACKKKDENPTGVLFSILLNYANNM